MIDDLKNNAVKVMPLVLPFNVPAALEFFLQYPEFEQLPVIVKEGSVKSLWLKDCIPLLLGCQNGQSCLELVTPTILKDIVCIDLKSKPNDMAAEIKQAIDKESSAMLTMGSLYIGMVLLRHILSFLKDSEIKEAITTSPLTGLPGNYSIQKEFLTTSKDSPLHVCYVDINDFKAYNDKYGVSKGDDVIKHTAVLLKEICPDDFVGHVGGDDFVVFIKDNAVTKLNNIAKNFDSTIKAFYSERHRQQGFITSTDRYGRLCEFPLMILSIAVKTVNEDCPFEIIAQSLASLKKVAKQKSIEQGASAYVFDQRQFSVTA